MILNYSKNPLKRIIGVIYHNGLMLLLFTVFSVAAYVLCHEFHYHELELPPIPVSILGGALAIFLGFKNSSAYDRWWEARKIWGAIVNDSRSIAMEFCTYGMPNEADTEAHEMWRQRTVRRQIGWNYALRSHLRKENFCDELPKWISTQEIQRLKGVANIPAQMLVDQAQDISLALKKGWIDEFRHMALMTTNKKMYDNQGKCERIKNTVFPFYYNYFTNFFMWLFTISLPFALASLMDSWVMIAFSVAISFAFAILNKSGIMTETPFEGRASDTPMSTIARGIEIDLLQMLQDDQIPDPVPDRMGKFGVMFKE